MSNGTPTPATPARTGPLTTEDAIPIIQTKIAEKGGIDSFKIKVQRQASFAAPLNHVASLSNATIEHIANPETWLVMLCGGGPFFVLTVTHAQDQLPTCTFRPTNLNGNPRDADPKIVNHPEWKGPPEITYPGNADKPVPSAAPGLFGFFGGPGAGPESAARGSGPQAGPGTSTSSDDRINEARFGLIQAQHKMELDALSKSIETQSKNVDRQIAALADVIKTVAARPVEVPKPQKSLTEQLAEITPLITAIGAVLLPVISKNKEIVAEDRRAQRDLEAKREERERADRLESMKMMQEINTRAASAGGDMIKVVSPMVDAVAQMSRTMLQNAATMRELTANDQPQDEGLTGIVKAGVAAFGDYMAAKAAAGGADAGEGQRRLPAAAQGPASVPGKTDPEEAEEQDPERTALLESLRTGNSEELLGRITDALKAKHDIGELVSGFLDLVSVNQGAAALVKAAGGPLPFFRQRLTDAWVMQKENMPYVQQVIAALAIEAKKRGMK